MRRSEHGRNGLLALDLSTHTGWAYGTAPDRRPVFGTWLLGNSAISLPAVWAALCDRLADAVTTYEPALVVMEAPLPAMRSKSEHIARLLIGLAVSVELVCWRRDVECREQDAGTVRREMLGTARPEKKDIVSWCVRQGDAVVDHNAADALVLWRWTARTVGMAR